MAANSFEFASLITMKALALYKNTLQVLPHFDTSWNSQFNQSFPIGMSFQIPLPQRFLTRTGLPYQPQPINARHTTVTMNEPIGVDFEWDDAEKAMLMPRGDDEVERRYLGPAMAALRQLADSQGAQFAAQNTPNVIGALGTNPLTFDDTSAPALQMMTEKAAPNGSDRALLIPPVVMRKVKQSAIAYMNPVADISKQYRKGIVGEADDFYWYNSMSLWRHTAGTWAGAVTVSGAGQTGSSLLVNCTSGDTWKKGDKISIANVLPTNLMTRKVYGAPAMTFDVTADVTATASTATLPIYPPIDGPGTQYQNVDSLPANTAALTLWPGTTSPNGKSGQIGLALDDNAFILVSRPLPTPSGSVEFAKQIRDPKTGISIRFVRQWSNDRSVMTNRFDMQLGFGVGLADASSIALACA